MASRSVLLESVDEECDEVALRYFVLCASLFHRLNESCVYLVVGEVLEYIRNAHFKDDVHTALEVKTETDLCFETLLIRVDAKILHGVLVVLLCDRILYLRSLAVIVLCGSREREIEDTCKRQKDGCYNYNTFVLHFFDLFFVIIIFSLCIQIACKVTDFFS